MRYKMLTCESQLACDTNMELFGMLDLLHPKGMSRFLFVSSQNSFQRNDSFIYNLSLVGIAPDQRQLLFTPLLLFFYNYYIQPVSLLPILYYNYKYANISYIL